MKRGLDHFTRGLSRVFQHYADALREGAPFVFTFHHNDTQAYVPLVVAILDAGMDCTATLPAPAEMGASLHIARTRSSVLDSIFVCRRMIVGRRSIPVKDQFKKDLSALESAGLALTEGDIRCLVAGHVARIAINHLRETWDATWPLDRRMSAANAVITSIGNQVDVESLVEGHRPEIGRKKGSRNATRGATI